MSGEQRQWQVGEGVFEQFGRLGEHCEFFDETGRQEGMRRFVTSRMGYAKDLKRGGGAGVRRKGRRDDSSAVDTKSWHSRRAKGHSTKEGD